MENNHYLMKQIIVYNYKPTSKHSKFIFLFVLQITSTQVSELKQSIFYCFFNNYTFYRFIQLYLFVFVFVSCYSIYDTHYFNILSKIKVRITQVKVRYAVFDIFILKKSFNDVSTLFQAHLKLYTQPTVSSNINTVFLTKVLTH